jgi:hypothetical protein
LRNALLDAIETAVGVSPILKLRTGASPGDGDVPSTGTVIATMNLPSDWMAAASGGSKALLGTWQDLGRCHRHGRALRTLQERRHARDPRQRHATGGGGDITLDNVSVNAGQAISITSWTLIAPNA